ncbi:Hypothetical protein A7982_00455 [Minicystis rosea]|nr:Hypothetical protein A7982_00455 [Minicystis rosea]
MPSTSPKLMNPDEAARALFAALADKGTDFTIADAAAKSGLPLRDAETGMHALVSEYRGHLRVTADGDLLFRFPNGFTKPWETRDKLTEIGRRVSRGALGVARFVVRAWISIVLVGYTAIFVALMLALMFARDSRDSRGGIGFELGYVFFRVVADALFWTFHPFSPFAYVDYGTVDVPGRRKRTKDETPFYEKVNRFFFGPQIPEPDPRTMERRILAEIRARKGRIGLVDVIRVTGLPREEADPLMARLMLDYEGTVEVSDEGGIFYRFESIRKTADETPMAPSKPIWARIKRLVPLTGNTAGTNLLIAGLNGFNLIMSLYALSNHLTFEKLAWLYDLTQYRGLYPPHAPQESTAIALGVIPLVFSIALFALPLARMALRPLKEKRIARENGRRAMLREILENVGHGEVTEDALKAAWKQAAGTEPDPKELTREVVALGGDVDYESGKVRYRFEDFEAEAKAVEAEREAASESEAKLGEVVFSSEN